MQKNIASQKLIVYAFDSTTNLPKTGDSANITAYVSKDYGTVTVLGDTSATEMDSTNAKGFYLFDLTQAETNGDTLLFSAKSSTSNIVVLGMPATVFTTPANFSKTVIDTNGTITTVTNLTNAPTSGDLTATMKASVQTAADAAVTANSLILEIEADTDTLTTGVIVTTNNDKTGYTLTAAYDAAKTAGDATAANQTAINNNVTSVYTRVGAPVGGSIAADIAEVEADVDTLLAGVTVSDKTGFSLASTGLDIVLVAGKTLPNALKYIGAICAGVVSGAGSGTETFQDFAGVTTVTVTVDSSGNRSAVVLA